MYSKISKKKKNDYIPLVYLNFNVNNFCSYLSFSNINIKNYDVGNTILSNVCTHN